MPTEPHPGDAKAPAMDDRTAGVAIPPPLLFAGGLAAGLAAGRIRLAPERASALARGLGAASVVAGMAFGAAAIRELKAVGTNVDPYKPSTALATGGVYNVSRNPAYVGATSIYVGIAMYARSLPAFVTLPIVLALLDRLVVRHEEGYLERLFGDDYRRYRERVPRWF